MKKIQKIRGMHEVNPSDSKIWSKITHKIIQIFESYSYNEIRLPTIESTDLFQRTVGELSDIVNKEMFTFESKSGKSLSLRPEGTASCLRSAIDFGLTDQGPIRLFYHGPMFRYERPQKGRSREFYQLSVEAYGFDSINIEFEMIEMSYKIFSSLDINNFFLEINSLGSIETQKNFSKALKDYLEPIKDQLDKDSRNRLGSNILRILDSKNTSTQEVLKKAPKIADFYDQESIDKFESLQSKLNEINIPFSINQNLVRGLDYYNDVVYEWKSEALGSQNTFCAGGRYDSLSKSLGGRDIPATGFSIGLDRLIFSISDDKKFDLKKSVIVIILENNLFKEGSKISEKIRNEFDSIVVRYDGQKSNLKSQLKKAIREKYDFAIILGSEEVKKNVYALKNLNLADNQITLSEEEIIQTIRNFING
ncbi:histidine--tRNA ligase [SAR86 cluster bacterium]|nr:histidine--tRNA ligase [SAR86 cluster bacterium]